MAYATLNDATIVIPSKDLSDIVLAAVGINPNASAATNVSNIAAASGVVSSAWIWGGVAVAAFFLLRKQ